MPDIADVAWSERDDRNSEAVPDGWPQGTMPAYVDETGRMMMGATKRFWNKINPIYQTSGTGDNYIVQTEVGVDQINIYELLCVRIDRSNTGTTPTLQFGATNARTIVKAGPSGYIPLIAGDMFAGNSHTFWYNGAFYVLTDPATPFGGPFQPLSTNLTTWAAINRAPGYDVFAATPSSANLAALLTDETGSGLAVFNNGPTFIAPILGTPASGVLTNATGLPISTGVSGLAANMATFLAGGTSAQLRASVTDETGTGALVFATSPTLVTPALGTPASGVATNLTGLPLTTGVTGTLGIGNGGTGQITAPAAFDALSPTTTRGDLIFRNATTNARLAAGTSGYALIAAGAGADPAWVGFIQTGTSPSTRTWQSKASDFVSILDFGAIGDGNIANAAVNATALTNALATGKIVFIPWTAAGYHFGTNQVTVASGQMILGENHVLLKSTATTSLLYLTGTTSAYSGVNNVSIDMTGAGGSSTAIRFATSLANVARVRMGSLKFTNCVEAIGDETSVSNFISDVMVTDVLCQFTLGRQVYNRRSNGFIVFQDFIIDHTQNSSLVSFESARFENFAGLELTRFDVTGYGTGTPAYNSSAPAITCAGNGTTAAALWLNRVFADTVIGDGIVIQTVNYVFTNYLEGSLARGHAITLNSVTNAVLENTIANGATGQTGAAAGADGLRILSSSDIAVSNLLSLNNTGDGLNINASNRVVATSLVSKTNTFGLAIQGTSANNVIVGGALSGNGTPVSNTASGTGNVINIVSGYSLGITGTATNDNAVAGYVGEYVETVVAIGSAVALTTATPKDIATISLTAGDWDVEFIPQFTGGATTTLTYALASISQTLNTLDQTNGRYVSQPYSGSTAFNNVPSAALGMGAITVRMSLAATTTIHAVAQASFGVSTCSGYGVLRARRVR
jgi:hypothetical protein